MIYGSQNVRCNRQKLLSFWAIFFPFSTLTTWKIKIVKLKKTPGDIVILHINYHKLQCTINYNLLMYGSWDMEHNRQNFLSFWTVFCPFTPLWTQKIKILKKWKKYLKILSFYKHKWQSYDAWFLRYGVQRTKCFVILDCLLPTNNPKNQNFENNLKMPRDIIILHMFTINDNHMMYRFWDIECDRQNVLVILDCFLPFYPLTTRKVKILKNWKKHPEISSFYNSVPTIMTICYTGPEIWCMTDVIIFHFGSFFALLQP